MEYLCLNNNLSYLYGWFAGDGGLYNDTRNRGRLSTEVNFRDKDIIEKLQHIFDSINIRSSIRMRTRDTNFKFNYQSISLIVYSLEFRKFFMKIGFQEGSKCLTMSPPIINFNKNAFARGFIDANGSICISKNDRLILSICITSDSMYSFFVDMINNICGYKLQLHRNKRDNVYNIVLTNKNAILFIKWLDYENINEISLDRKREKALELIDKYKIMCKQQD